MGEVAPRTIKAPFRFSFKNLEAYERRRNEAAELEPTVFRYTPAIASERKELVHEAFEAGRAGIAAGLAALPVPDDKTKGKAGSTKGGGGEAIVLPTPADLSQESRDAIVRTVIAQLGVRVPAEDVERLLVAGFPLAAEDLATELIGKMMAKPIVRSRDDLPSSPRPIRVIEERGLERQENLVRDWAQRLITPSEARELAPIALLESAHAGAHWSDAVTRLAKAMVQPNFTYQAEWTNERKKQAAASVELDLDQVKRGATLFRQGDILTPLDLVKYEALREHQGEQNYLVEVAAVALFMLLLLTSLYQFGASYLPGFSTRVRDIASAGVLLVLVSLFARLGVASSVGVAAMVGMEAEPSSVWFVVPVAGAAMLVRVLMGVAWTVVFSFAASITCGLVMDMQALPVVFFMLSCVAGAGAIEGTRERIYVLRAGLYTGVVGAACVLLIHFLKLSLTDAEISLATRMRPVWSMSFAFVGGLLSSFVVLGLVPVFEAMGFVTDYRLMELANLNHPVMRNLMLRAPGTYHHSVMVGTLAEAGCEAIGANALQAKVAAYFHDIGKSFKPDYFVENQKGGINKHDALDPVTSAQIIIDHVVSGGRMAKEHNLPAPIVNNIYMHHGTGLLVFFYRKALEQAEDRSLVREEDFRYPGPKPSTQEAGVIMLADKVEAATRTLKKPTEANIRKMINQIVNSTIQDGQFTDCPLTLEHIYTVSEVFVTVLTSIYHQRVEYPDTRHISSQGRPGTPIAPPRREAIITLDVAPKQPAPWSERDVPAPGEFAQQSQAELEAKGDYEAVEHLPGGGGKG